jgi:RNA polymerase-binding protein DksA
MARTTAGKLASRTAAVAKRVTASVAKKGASGSAETSPSTPTPSGSAAAKAPATKKAAAKKTAAKKAPAKPASEAQPTPGRKTAKPAKISPAKKAAAEKVAAAATSTVPAKKAGGQTTEKKSAAKKTPARKSPAKKAPARKTSAGNRTAPGPTGAASLPVKPDESPWTEAELDEVKNELHADVLRLQEELDLAGRELDGLMRDAGDGAGHDQADVGSTTFERDHEMSLANNARDMLTQTSHALERIENGSYGICESCGQPIGKNRLMAFPRATLCLTCKQREERR